MSRSMIPMKKVQQAFSHAVLRRDCRCVVRGYEPCGGTTGSTTARRTASTGGGLR